MEFLAHDDAEPKVRRPRFLADVPQTTRRPGFLGDDPEAAPAVAPAPAEVPPVPDEPRPARVDQYVNPPFVEPTPPPMDAAPARQEAEHRAPITPEVSAAPAAKEPAIVPPSAPPAPVQVHDDRLRDAVDVLRRTAETLAEQARADALEIGLEVARHIIEQELKTNIKPILRMVRDAVHFAGEARKVSVHLCPEDAERLLAAHEEGRAGGLALAEVNVVADAQLSAGDVEVETEFGNVDGRLSRRFDDIRRVMRSGVRQTGSGK